MASTAVNLWIISILAASVVQSQPGWNYDGSHGLLAPSNWTTGYPACGGTYQSPINISSTSAIQSTGQLTFKGYNTTSNRSFTLLNNGHSIRLNTNVKTISLVNSRLNGTYVLEQVHFHWGASDSVGSEHSIDNKFHPLEIHFVHFNGDKYANVTDASKYDDSSAVLVLGVFASVVEDRNTTSAALNSLITYFTSVQYLGNTTSIASFPLEGLLPCQQSKVYTYSGSRTNPLCAQDVNWNVFDQPIYVTSDQLKSFRAVHGENAIDFNTFNYRPAQPLNGRFVYAYNVSSPCTPKPQIPIPGSGVEHQQQCNWLMMLLFFAAALFATPF